MSQTIQGLDCPDPTAVTPPADEELRNAFVTSNETALDNLEAAALALEKDLADPEPLQEAKRILHTIKGESGFLDMPTVSEVCHRAETELARLTDAGECPTDFLLRVKDWLKAVVDHVSGAETVPADADEEAAAPAEATGDEARAAGGINILVVEDNPVSQQILKGLLSNFGPVAVAGDGRAGLEAFRQALESGRPFDLACLDIMMPEMDGQEMLKRMREFEEERGLLGLDGVKVIMTTALGDAKNVLRSFRTGCEGYLVKPISKDRLLAELRKLDLAQ